MQEPHYVHAEHMYEAWAVSIPLPQSFAYFYVRAPQKTMKERLVKGLHVLHLNMAHLAVPAPIQILIQAILTT